MLGLGELIFVLVIVVQGVAAIAAAAQKKKKRAAARAEEIAAEEGRGATSTRSFVSSSQKQAQAQLASQENVQIARKRELALQKRLANKELKQEKRQAKLNQLRQVMESSTGVSMKDAMSMMGISVATADASGRSRSTQASRSGNANLGTRPVPVMVPASSRPPAPRRAIDEVPVSSIHAPGRKAKPSPFTSGNGGAAMNRSQGQRAQQRAGLSLRGTLRNRRALRQAFVLKTLLEPPVALRDDPETVG
jgi:hypothetical protein